jgi:hypothetical protein
MPPAIATIDVSEVSVTERMVCPRTWAEAANWLGASQPTVSKCRAALGRWDEPLSAELFEEVGRMVRWCDRRNKGGGAKCTHREYMRLKNLGQDFLDKELIKQGVI